jgi:hypothetical protein
MLNGLIAKLLRQKWTQCRNKDKDLCFKIGLVVVIGSYVVPLVFGAILFL